ncbi:MAG: hypothetical protein K0M45_07120, partial [Candidatus Paracaedibacteraceae bacterium]|nr:hypothetical protein [Candidatus Paracaedibacteraceae bacterium]
RSGKQDHQHHRHLHPLQDQHILHQQVARCLQGLQAINICLTQDFPPCSCFKEQHQKNGTSHHVI